MENIVLIISLIIGGFVITFLLLKKKVMELVNPGSIIGEIRKEIDQIILELNRTTDRNIGLIEDKINSISDLLSKADKRILILQRENEKHNLTQNYSNIIKQNVRKQVSNTPLPVKEVKVKEKELSVNDMVLQLYREGFDKSVIAGKLNVPVGEVELIISLNNRG